MEDNEKKLKSLEIKISDKENIEIINDLDNYNDIIVDNDIDKETANLLNHKFSIYKKKKQLYSNINNNYYFINVCYSFINNNIDNIYNRTK